MTVVVDDPFSLTPRERDVARLLRYPNKDIASMLFIEQQTVKDHVVSIMAKTGATTRTDAALRLAGL